jgi:hypothetical protein
MPVDFDSSFSWNEEFTANDWMNPLFKFVQYWNTGTEILSVEENMPENIWDSSLR